MTRKDYKLIASILNGFTIMFPPESTTHNDKTCFLLGCADQKAMYVREFAARLASENPRFDSAKFIAACNED